MTKSNPGQPELRVLVLLMALRDLMLLSWRRRRKLGKQRQSPPQGKLSSSFCGFVCDVRKRRVWLITRICGSWVGSTTRGDGGSKAFGGQAVENWLRVSTGLSAGRTSRQSRYDEVSFVTRRLGMSTRLSSISRGPKDGNEKRAIAGVEQQQQRLAAIEGEVQGSCSFVSLPPG